MTNADKTQLGSIHSKNTNNAAQLSDWEDTVLVLSAISTTLGSMYPTLLTTYSYPYPPAVLYPWFNKFTPTQKYQLLKLIRNLHAEVKSLGKMVKQGIALINAGEPPNISPPAYQVPPWSLNNHKHLLLAAIWQSLSPSLIVMLSAINLTNYSILKIILISTLLRLGAYIDTVEEIFSL